jgi:hypothetical protein
MIKLYSECFLIPSTDGREIPYDFEALRTDLEGCFAAVGIHEPWVSDHILVAVREQLLAGATAGREQVAEAKAVDRIVSKLLIDAGYPDAAAEFNQKRRGQSPAGTISTKQGWDEQRVAAVISQHLPLSAAAAQELAAQVAEKLRHLQFPVVGDVLIREVAEHCLETAARRCRAPAPASDGWLMPPGYWQTFLPADQARLVHRQVLVVHPVSRLMPAIRLTLDLAALAESQPHGGVWTELQFLPLLRQTCGQVLTVLETLQTQADELQPANSSSAPAYLVATNLDQVLGYSFGQLRKAQARSLKREIINTIRDAFTALAPGRRLVVSITGDRSYCSKGS